MSTLLIASRKGLFTADRAERTGLWQVSSHHFHGEPVTQVLADHRDGVVSLPTSAVSTRGTTATVTVRAKTGKETQVPITIGLRGDSSVEITSGLNAGVYELNSAVVTALGSADAAERWAKGEEVFHTPLKIPEKAAARAT